MPIPGHTTFVGVQPLPFPPGGVRITLECACGIVLRGGEFVVDDVLNRQHIREEGREAALEHEREMRGRLAAVLVRKES